MNNEKLKNNLELLRFKEHGAYGAMVGYVEDVKFTAIEHPFGKVFVLIADYASERVIAKIEENVLIDADIKEIDKVMTKLYESIKF